MIPLVLPAVALALLLLHIPPGTVLVSVIRPATQTVVGPLMVPALDKGLMVTTNREMEVPQPLVTVYLIVSMPAVTPVAMPPDVMDALPKLVLQVPPAVGLVNAPVVVTHITGGPEITPTAGEEFTVTIVVVKQPPIEYMIVDVPSVKPATVPVVSPIVATGKLVLLHVPPNMALVNVRDPPAHTLGAAGNMVAGVIPTVIFLIA